LVVGLATVGIAWFISCAIGGRGPLLFLALFHLNRTFLTWGTSLRAYGLGSAVAMIVAAIAFLRPGWRRRDQRSASHRGDRSGSGSRVRVSAQFSGARPLS